MSRSPELDEHSCPNEHSSPSCLIQPFSSLSMLQPVRVLPSNAPPLVPTDSSNRSNPRALQEHSVNRQPSMLDLPEKRSTLSTENSHGSHIVPTPDYQNTVIQNPPGYYHQIQKFANRHSDRKHAEKYLFDRFRTSEQWVKYRNRQRAHNKIAEDAKWPDPLEYAFFKALVKWPPMGRKKFIHKGRPRGRNELIADHIHDLTGETRDRKQISSHIQVLKPFVRNDPFIMKYLSCPDNTADSSTRPNDTVYYTGKQMSTYRKRSSSAPSRRSKAFEKIDLQSLAPAWNLLELFRPANFDMFVQRKAKDSEDLERIHTYTSDRHSDHVSTIEFSLHNMQRFTDRFPLLSCLHQNKPLQCNILLAQASMAFSTAEAWKDEDENCSSDVKLYIYYAFISACLPTTADLRCRNRFYRNDEYLEDDSGRPFRVQLSPSKESSGTDAVVRFGSKFWAKTLSRIAAEIRESAEPLEDAWKEADAHLASITVCQEFLIRTDEAKEYERLLVIQWNFSLAEVGTPGRTTWSRIILPVDTTVPDVVASSSTSSSSLDPIPIPIANPIIPQQPSLQSPFKYESTCSTNNYPSWHPDLSLHHLSPTPPHSIGLGPDQTLPVDVHHHLHQLDYDPSTFDYAFPLAPSTTPETSLQFPPPLSHQVSGLGLGLGIWPHEQHHHQHPHPYLSSTSASSSTATVSAPALASQFSPTELEKETIARLLCHRVEEEEVGVGKIEAEGPALDRYREPTSSPTSPSSYPVEAEVDWFENPAGEEGYALMQPSLQQHHGRHHHQGLHHDGLNHESSQHDPRTPFQHHLQQQHQQQQHRDDDNGTMGSFGVIGCGDGGLAETQAYAGAVGENGNEKGGAVDEF